MFDPTKSEHSRTESGMAEHISSFILHKDLEHRECFLWLPYLKINLLPCIITEPVWEQKLIASRYRPAPTTKGHVVHKQLQSPDWPALTGYLEDSYRGLWAKLKIFIWLLIYCHFTTNVILSHFAKQAEAIYIQIYEVNSHAVTVILVWF